jgi:hypothetical protein
VDGLDLKHVGLIGSVGAAVSLRFLSDFSFATIRHQAALGGLDLTHLSVVGLASLVMTTLQYELQRDWFNLTPQAWPEVVGSTLLLVLAYGLLRSRLAAEAAASIVLVVAPLIGVVILVSACAFVLARSSPSA